MTDEDLSSQLHQLSHQLTVLPDETIAFYASDSGIDGCDDIKERAPSGTVRTLVNSQTRAGHDRPVPRQQHPVLAAGRHAGLLRPHSLRGREDQADRWVDRLDPEQRPRRSPATPGLAASMASTSSARRLPDLQQQHAPDRRQHRARWHRRRFGRPRDQAGSDRQDRHQDLVLQGDGDDVPDRRHGRLQRMANGNLVIAFGGKGIIQEIKPDGTVLQELRTQPTSVTSRSAPHLDRIAAHFPGDAAIEGDAVGRTVDDGDQLLPAVDRSR